MILRKGGEGGSDERVRQSGDHIPLTDRVVCAALPTLILPDLMIESPWVDVKVLGRRFDEGHGPVPFDGALFDAERRWRRTAAPFDPA